MDAAQLLEEYRLAQEEHARALAEVEQMRMRVEAARVEADRARATERKYEREMEVATAKLVEGLTTLRVEDVVDNEDESTSSLLPPVNDYLVEYHANIGCYHCYLFVGARGPSAVDTTALSVSVALTKVALSSAAGEWWAVELERKADAESCSITNKDDHIYVRLPVSPSDKETVDGFASFSQTSQEELRVDSYRTLSCRGCGAVFVNGPQAGSVLDKVLPLPSENWMEMFDFWGAGIGSFEHIPREGIFAHEHRIFVGESNIILHENDLTGKGVFVDTTDETKQGEEEGEEPLEWVNVRCAQCKVVIGDRRVENQATLRLQKHLLAASSRDAAPKNVFERYTIDSTISAQMLHVAESDGVFRFLLKAPNGDDELAGFAGLQLQLLSWDTKIHGSAVSACASEFRRVLKVVYATGPGVAVAPVPAVQAELPPMLRTHELVVTPAIGREIMNRLEESTLLLPASQRSFNKMAVGFLYA